MEEMRNVYKILNRKMEGRNHLTELGIIGRMVLKYILKVNTVCGG